MIVRLTGRLESVDGLSAVLSEREGLAREVLVPAFLAERLLERVGTQITFHTMEYLESRDQGAAFIPRLIGFESKVDRRFFELLTTVKGIGNRKALRAMAMHPGEIAGAIAERDAATLQKLPEVGKRLAETIIAELSGKLDSLGLELSAAEVKPGRPSGNLSPAAEEAVAALIALGDPPPDANKRVQRAIERKPGLTTSDEILAAAIGT